LNLRRQLLVSFGVQGMGAASVLLATLWLGLSLGPEVQGGFSHTKAEIEFVAAFAMFGLPQALFYYVKSGGLSSRQALRWAGGSAVLALFIGIAYTSLRDSGGASPLWAVLSMGAAVAACVAHGQLRALLLVGERTAGFSAVTALPQIAVLVGVASAIAMGAHSLQSWSIVFALAFGIAALLAWHWLPAMQVPPSATPAGWRSLGHYGLAAWLTAALPTAAILLVQRWVEVGQGRVALGQFTMAMTLVQLPLVPIAYAAPLLFRHWMDRPGADASRRWASALFVGLSSLAVLVWALAPAWPDLGLGAAYHGATRAFAVLLAGGAAEAASRVLTVQAGASGLPWVAVRAEAVRWVVLAIGACGLLLAGPSPQAAVPSGVLPVCGVWAAAAWAAALVFVLHARKGDAR
jgi:hypothetical protein